NTYIRGYAANRNNNYDDIAPLPECVKPDNSFREFMVHTKYMAGRVNGKMTACSGVIPWTYQSHNNWQTNAKAIGSQYSGTTSADISFLEIMANIKYGLTLDGIIQGCCNMNYQYVAQVAESGVKRVILDPSDAANLEVGMSCLVGNYAGNTDRGQSAMYSITGNGGAIITDIYTVLINGTEYSAVDLDVSTAFDTAANGSAVEGTTYLSSFHWPTGATDGVLGNDGSPVSNTSGKYPGKIQGIEFMNGCYETLTDTILNMYYDGDDCYYEPNIVRSSADQTTSITDNYEATGQKCPDTVTSASWQYIKKKSYKKGVLFPETLGGSSSTYHKNGFYQAVPAAQTREWLACGNLNNGVTGAGLSALTGNNALSSSRWYYGSRLSPNGNRGEWTA
ncbi:MAG: hypothetical protein LUD72_10445, partial [Bacteroidales bacterium]|nr:hypothetical protein [Bacteroidales bacterium]